ncbi:ABC transporter substrate-binding protein [Vibrio sp. MA40-2]|uniref:ABC transporter substrate-binding protein n=1 Tax=Vibrio sp. MA40-2 TaxID=3391828 RepID=UPI0039A4A5F2
MIRFLTLLFIFSVSYPFSVVQAADEVKIGAIFAKTGEAAEENLVLFQAARFAVDEINSKGGIRGKKVRLLEYDNHSTAIQSLLAAKQAVKDNVVAVIGASWSTHSLAIAPYLQKMQVPMISPDSTNPKLTKIGDYIFRACVSDTWQGKILANFAANHLKSQRVVILQNIKSDYSIGLAEVFQNDFGKMGGEVVAVYNYKTQQTDLTAELEQVKDLEPDLLFIPGYGESGYIVKQARKMGIKAKMMGGDTWSYKEFVAYGGQDLEEGYYSSHWNKNLETKEAQDFVKRYSINYEVTDYVAGGYDAAMILFEAIERADSLDRKAIRDQLAVTKDYKGVTGNITFDQNGDAIKQMLMIKITDGKTNIVATIKPEQG